MQSVPPATKYRANWHSTIQKTLSLRKHKLSAGFTQKEGRAGYARPSEVVLGKIRIFPEVLPEVRLRLRQLPWER